MFPDDMPIKEFALTVQTCDGQCELLTNLRLHMHHRAGFRFFGASAPQVSIEVQMPLNEKNGAAVQGLPSRKWD
jgi:hypothetical protein